MHGRPCPQARYRVYSAARYLAGVEDSTGDTDLTVTAILPA